MRRNLILDGIAASCFFRSSVEQPNRKAVIQITERCNLHCAHCFVSAEACGDSVDLNLFTEKVLPRLKECRITSVTLTGGEPFVHQDLMAMVKLLRREAIRVGICSNATLITDEQIESLVTIGGVHLNVSLDGFRSESHGRFRGNPESFFTTINTIKRLGEAGLLQGLLVTPNNLATVSEYKDLCEFAVGSGAEYVLMNPLSSFGRGVKSKSQLKADMETMNAIRQVTLPYQDRLDLTYIRFPNDSLPLGGCEAKGIVYMFVNGDLTVCPYLVFAARTPGSHYDPASFIPGNIIHDPDIAERLDNYDFRAHCKSVANPTCASCSLSENCGKGCPAAVIADGARMGELDAEVCPAVSKLMGGHSNVS